MKRPANGDMMIDPVAPIDSDESAIKIAPPTRRQFFSATCVYLPRRFMIQLLSTLNHSGDISSATRRRELLDREFTRREARKSIQRAGGDGADLPGS